MPEQKKKTAGTSARKSSGKSSVSKDTASNKSKTNTRRSTRKSAASHRKHSQLSRAQEVKRLKILIAAVTATVLIIGGLLIHRLLFPINKGSLTGVSDEVLQYQGKSLQGCRHFSVFHCYAGHDAAGKFRSGYRRFAVFRMSV